MRVLIEKYHGIDIYFDKDTSRLTATNPKTGEVFNGTWLGEIRRDIDDCFWEETDENGIILSGYFDKQLSKIKSIRRNKKTKKGDYKIIDTTGSRYEIGKTVENSHNIVIYPITEHNIQIYDKVASLQLEITAIEQEQRRIIKTLSCER